MRLQPKFFPGLPVLKLPGFPRSERKEPAESVRILAGSKLFFSNLFEYFQASVQRREVLISRRCGDSAERHLRD